MANSTLLPLHMALSLARTFVECAFQVVSVLPVVLIQTLFSKERATGPANCTFYEGSVFHVREAPVTNSFRYPVRVALVDLETPPTWWAASASEHMTAEQARAVAGTAGPVKLLTNPATAGYSQNPISVFYCFTKGGDLEKCIAVVTNTPWAARVSFLFNPSGQEVPKALHVSPFMDMESTWHLKAPLPGQHLHLTVAVSHPLHGRYFHAVLTGEVADAPGLRNEHAGWRVLLRYGFQPQRVACLIYWQAIKLLWKGVPFFSPPDRSYRQRVDERLKTEAGQAGPEMCWVGAQSFPWNVQQ